MERPRYQRDPWAEDVASLLKVYILPLLAKWAGGNGLLAPRPLSKEGDLLMGRRALLIMAAMMLGVLLLGGVALADTIDGTSGPDDLVGTDNDDVIHASGGADYVSGLAGPDLVYAGAGNDTISSAGDGVRDVVKCGIGKNDTAYVDKIDWVKKNCENVYLLVRTSDA